MECAICQSVAIKYKIKKVSVPNISKCHVTFSLNLSEINIQSYCKKQK